MKVAVEPQLTENGNIKDVEKGFIQLGFENITLTLILLVAEGNEKKILWIVSRLAHMAISLAIFIKRVYQSH
ncbi:TPA: hypothetical protein ACGPA2_001305 [Streptococcus suis]